VALLQVQVERTADALPPATYGVTSGPPQVDKWTALSGPLSKVGCVAWRVVLPRVQAACRGFRVQTETIEQSILCPGGSRLEDPPHHLRTTVGSCPLHLVWRGVRPQGQVA